MKKANLFIVGHPKTGTSSLFSYLKGHKDICMSSIKEPYFFTKDFHLESDNYHGTPKHFPFRNEKAYLALFKRRENEKVLGEASALTLYSKAAAKEICRYNPDSKIIIILREPVDFLYSYHSTAIFSLGEDKLDFTDAINSEEKRKSGSALSNRIVVPSWLFYSELIEYSNQINRFKSVFNSEQIKILIFDDFKKETERIYNEILKFLSIDSSYKPEFNIVNPSQIVKFPLLKHYLETPFLYKFVRKIISNEAYANLVSLYKNFIVLQ